MAGYGVGGRDPFGAWQTDGERCNDVELWSEAVADPVSNGLQVSRCNEVVTKGSFLNRNIASQTLSSHLYDRRFQVIWFTIFLSLVKKITVGRWLSGWSRQRQQYWWRGFKKHASRKQNFSDETALATLDTLVKTEHLLATHSLTHYERTPFGESPHRRFAVTFPRGVG
jgi:hypothetical protein